MRWERSERAPVGGYVYRFDPITGGFRHLHDFVGSDGAVPTGPLFQAADGFFYGTTNQGGPWNSGVIYKVDVLGHFALLHSLSPFFPGEGSEPKGGVIQASDGFFYGTTEQGGYFGEIFRMDAAGNFTVIHRFDSYASDGGRPRERPDRGPRRLPLRDGSRSAASRSLSEPPWGRLPDGQGRHRHGRAHVHGPGRPASRRPRSCKARTGGCTAPRSSAERSGSACCSASIPRLRPRCRL